MRIALATSPGSADISKDDVLLAAALEALNVEASVREWEDPKVDWGAFYAVAVRTTWDYHVRLEAFLRWIESVSKQTRLVNDASTIRWNVHKAYLVELAERGVPTVPTIVLNAPPGVDQVAKVNSHKVVLKPEVGASAQETGVFDANDFPGILRHSKAILERNLLLLQPYLDQVETDGELSLIWIDGRVTHAIRKRPKPGDFRVQIDHGGTNERVEPPEDGLELARQCIEALPSAPLFARVDAVRDAEGTLRLMELELIEPELMFEWAPESASVLAEALLR